MNPIDRYMDDLASRLHLSGRGRRRILEEVRDHLTDAASVGAEDTAVEAFGSAPTLARQFNADAGARNVRRAPFVAAVSGVVVVVAIIAAARHQSLAGVRPSVATEISFFLGMLGVQVSFVAWVRAGCRTSAIWHTSAMRGADRALVRRCSLISSGSMICASFAFAVAFAFIAADGAQGTDAPALVASAIVMVTASIAGFELIRRAPANASDEIGSDEIGSSGSRSGEGVAAPILEIGERAVSRVRAHPVLALLATASAAGWSAAAHAETSLTRSLPWVVPEVAAVVIAFIVLGPVLALRAPRTRHSTL